MSLARAGGGALQIAGLVWAFLPGVGELSLFVGIVRYAVGTVPAMWAAETVAGAAAMLA